MIYLNDAFEGGATLFQDATAPAKDYATVTPAAGRIVLFEHGLFHCGGRVTAGEKYVLRTDVMFSAAAPAPLPPPPPPPPSPPQSVADLVAALGLGDDASAPLGALGLLDGSVDALRGAGRAALDAMLADSELDASALARFLDAAFDENRAAPAPPAFLSGRVEFVN